MGFFKTAQEKLDLKFFKAFLKGDLISAAFELATGANVNATFDYLMPGVSYKRPWRALEIAIHKGDIETIDWLIRCKASTSYLDHHNWPPLEQAVAHVDPKTEIIRLLFEHSAESAQFSGMKSAISFGNEVIIKQMIDMGLNIKDSNLINAAIQEQTNLKIITILLDAGADPNTQDRSESDIALLHRAVYFGDKNLLRLLLERGANPNTPDRNGHTPLHWAAARKNMGGYIDLLMKAGADPNARNDAGLTPHEFAVEKGNYITAEQLQPKTRAPAPKSTPAPAADDGWIKTDPYEIARRQDRPALGMSITEIFNFAKGEYTKRISEASQTPSQSVLFFNDFISAGNVKTLEEACDELIRQGGKATREDIYRNAPRLDKRKA